LIPTGERSGLQTHIAVTESVSSPDERRNLNELAFESDRREWDKEEVSQALMRHEKKSQTGTRPGLFGRNSPIESTG
jgi:hypothetical protein